MNEALKERKHHMRRETILGVTQRLMATKGFTAMTMDDIANGAGISKATLYQDFRSKEDLAVDVVIQTLRQFITFVEALDASLPAIVRLRRVVRCMLTLRFSDKLDFHEAEATVPVLLKKHADYVVQDKRVMGHLVDLIGEVQKDGGIPVGLSPRAVAQMMISSIKDASYRELLRDGTFTLETMEQTMLWFITGKADDIGNE